MPKSIRPRLALPAYTILLLCVAVAPSLAALGPVSAGDFVQFRGNAGLGHADEKDLPVGWSETENVAWKKPIDGLGWSSPAIQGRHLWLTTALNDGRELRAICLDVKSGDVVHDVEVFRIAQPGPIHAENSHASPTPLIDGDRVFVHFGAHGTACVSTDGKVLWRTQKLKYNHVHGPGGSPVVYENLLILNCDGGDVQFVVALDKATGEIVWKTPRKHISQARRSGADRPGMGFSTPLLIEVDGKTQLVSTGGDHVAAYDPRTGEEIWWSAYNGYSLVPRPVFGQGLVYVCCGFPSPVLYAIRPDGSGEVTKSHVAWSDSRGVPLNPSPLLVGDELYMVSDNGVLKCLDAKNGQTHWQQRLEGNVWASPLHADGKIYVLDKKGVCTVIAPDTTYRELSKNRLDGRTQASIAAADGALFLRTDRAVYRIENARP